MKAERNGTALPRASHLRARPVGGPSKGQDAMLEPHLIALTQTLADAIRHRDQASVRALCAPGAYEAGDHAVQEFLELLTRTGGTPELPAETCVEHPRAYVAMNVRTHDTQARSKAFVLFEAVQEIWAIAGVTVNLGAAVLFISAAAAPTLTWETLPPGPEARTWFTLLLDQVRAGDEAALERWAVEMPQSVRWLLPRLYMLQHQLNASVRCVETRAHPEVRRQAALIEVRMSDGAQDAFWVMLREAPETQQLVPFETSTLPSLKLLLEGIEWLR